MSLEFLSHLIESEPFVPMVLFLADGRSFPVQNPELIMIAADSRSVSLFTPPDVTEFIDLALIVSVRVEDLHP